MFRRTAHFPDEIPKGAKPADLPAERLTRFNFSINLKAAKPSALTIPPSLPIRMDRENWHPKRMVIIEFQADLTPN